MIDVLGEYIVDDFGRRWYLSLPVCHHARVNNGQCMTCGEFFRAPVEPKDTAYAQPSSRFFRGDGVEEFPTMSRVDFKEEK